MRGILRLLRWLLILAVLVLVAFLTRGLWLSALGGYLVQAETPTKADVVVVLAGDYLGSRILTAAGLVREGLAPQAMISGPAGAYGLHETDLAIPFAVKNGYPESYFIAVPNDSKSTVDEAGELIPALRKMHAHRIEIVTSDYHTRRAGKIFRTRAPDLDIHMVAAPDRYFSQDGWWKNREGRKIFLTEWMKTVANWLGM